MLKHGVFIAIWILAGAAGGFSQGRFELQFGASAGLPFSISMESRLPGFAGPFASHAYDRAPFFAGPAVRAAFNDRITLGFDALYKPVRGRGSERFETSRETLSTSGSTWDFPLIVDYHVLKSTPRLYFGLGLVVGAITRGTTEIRSTDIQTGASSMRTEELRAKRQVPAPIINGGLEWRAGGLVIRPEMRYTRWRRVDATLAARHFNQFEYLIGFSFRSYER